MGQKEMTAGAFQTANGPEKSRTSAWSYIQTPTFMPSPFTHNEEFN